MSCNPKGPYIESGDLQGNDLFSIFDRSGSSMRWCPSSVLLQYIYENKDKFPTVSSGSYTQGTLTLTMNNGETVQVAGFKRDDFSSITDETENRAIGVETTTGNSPVMLSVTVENETAITIDIDGFPAAYKGNGFVSGIIPGSTKVTVNGAGATLVKWLEVK